MRSKLSAWCLLLFLAPSCEDADRLHSFCDEICVAVGSEILVDQPLEARGACHPGVLSCGEGEPVCVGSVAPRTEVCNGVDDDCDGVTDDLPVIQVGDARNDCPTTEEGVCKASAQECLGGQMVCVPPDGFYGPEVCDGLDNDCDGLVDEDTFEDPMFTQEERLYYPDDFSTLNVGVCRAGIRLCDGGLEVVRGYVGPAEEVCGDALDNDCDGEVDEAPASADPTQFLFILDFSTSMGLAVENVVNATCEWSADPQFVNDQFAVLAVGVQADEYIFRVSNFDTAEATCARLTAFYQGRFQEYGIEYQVDAILYSFEENHGVSWGDDFHKEVVIFTDEQPQSREFSSPSSEQGLEVYDRVVALCAERAVTVNGFIDISDTALWAPLIQGCNGFTSNIRSRASAIQAVLAGNFSGVCGD